MKLNRVTTIAAAAAAVALACGCSSTPAPRTATASAALLGDRAYQSSADGRTPADPNVTGTTSLMSAKLPAPAPKVGKAHLAADDDVEAAPAGGDTDADLADLDTREAKAGRRSDGSRRSGGFGSAK